MKKMFCTLALAMGVSCAYGSDMPNLISLQDARVQRGQEICSNLAELPEDQRVRAGDSLDTRDIADFFEFIAAS